MTQSTLLLALISTLLTIVYLVLSYIGVLRYWRLYWQDSSALIERYPTLPKADKDRVVISMAVTGQDLKNHMNKFWHATKSLLDQTVKVDEICLLIPYKDMGLVTPDIKKIYAVYGYSKDYKICPQSSNLDKRFAVNLINAVLREPDARTRIILVRPDYIYDHEFTHDILEAAKKKDGPLVGKEAIVITPGMFDESITSYNCNSSNNSSSKSSSTCIDFCKKASAAIPYLFNWPALKG
jgi:hypothetical protein